MGVACMFGHKWRGCTCEKCGAVRDEGHNWDGCTCRICGKVREEEHDFIRVPDKCEEVCCICGKKRVIPHKWNGCKCERCGITRDEGHVFKPAGEKCEERCELCGKVQEGNHDFKPVPGECKQRCEKCGKTEELPHEYEPVPGECKERCKVCGREKETAHEFQNGICSRCGQLSATPYSLSSLTSEEINAVGTALNIGRKSNKGPSLEASYQSALGQLRRGEMGPVELAVTLTTLDSVNKALSLDITGVAGNDPRAALLRVGIIQRMRQVIDKLGRIVNDVDKRQKEVKNRAGRQKDQAAEHRETAEETAFEVTGVPVIFGKPVAIGNVRSGELHIGDVVSVRAPDGSVRHEKAKILAIKAEKFRQKDSAGSAEKGPFGIILDCVRSAEDIRTADVICIPGD